MSTLSTADYLKFANLQLAAEALYGFNATREALTLVPGNLRKDIAIDSDNLITGNEHTSKFTATEVELSKLTTDWVVVEHLSNTTTGFSGTLFKNKDSGEFVLSFRSTEFIDDAARDNQATNQLEIYQKGWAFGQLADMEDWYASLQSRITGALSVTGYSLGGHLATAFNLIHPGDAQQVVTFNGAGVGKIGGADTLEAMQVTLPQMIASFDALRDQGDLSAALATAFGKKAYQAIQAQLTAPNVVFDNALRESLQATLDAEIPMRMGTDYLLLKEALARVVEVGTEAARVGTLNAGGGSGPQAPASIPVESIAAVSLDYQLAVLLTVEQYQTSSLSIGASLANTFIGKTPGPGLLANQIDLVGTEMGGASVTAMVANSQVHYGTNQAVYIEDQPLYRGAAPTDAALTSLVNGGAKLLVDGYSQTDFGDTHSLILIVDSLNAQNAILQLLPETERASATLQLNDVFKAASYLKRVNGDFMFGSGQGTAEGDVLENVVNALADMMLGLGNGPARLKGSADGNTWADIAGPSGYTGRTEFYVLLDAIQNSPAYVALEGALSLQTAAEITAGTARTDFGQFLALATLSPLALSPANGLSQEAFKAALAADWGETYTAWKADADRVALSQAPLEISAQWLKDRADFLTRKTWFNSRNINPENPDYKFDGRAPAYLNDNALYQDEASNYQIAQGFAADSPFDGTHRYHFGNEQANTYTGGGVEDHLYGGGGIDILSGQAGDDWLEVGGGWPPLLAKNWTQRHFAAKDAERMAA